MNPESQIIAASQLTMEWIVASSSISSWNPRGYVDFDFRLGIIEEWLPKYPVASATVIESKSLGSTSLTNDDNDDDDKASFWQSLGAIEETEWKELTVDHRDVSLQTAKPSPKRMKLSPPRLSLSLNKLSRRGYTSNAPLKDCTNSSELYFSMPVSSPERVKASKGVIPGNTEASSQWALRNFTEWSVNCCSLIPDDPVLKELLASHDAYLVCKWLCRFVLETRKTDGSFYPPSTLRSLLSGLNRVVQSNQVPFSVLDKGDTRFRPLLKTLDSLSSELHRSGIGVTKNSAKVIELEHENLFWRNGLLGYSTPRILQRTVFFYVGLNFVLRGIQEQHDLVTSQFNHVPQDRGIYDASVYYEYRE